MTCLWEPEAKFRIWLEIETLAAEAIPGLVVVPLLCAVALLLGVTLGEELVTGFEWLAAAIVLCGVGMLMWRPAAAARTG